MKRTPKAEEIHNSFTHVTPQLSHFLLIQGWGPLSLFRKGYLDIYKSTVHWNASTPLVLAFVYPRLTNNFKFVSKFTAFRRPHPSLFAFFSALCRWQHHDRQASHLHSWNVWSVESLSAWHKYFTGKTSVCIGMCVSLKLNVRGITLARPLLPGQ